jgi:hypothetical protein
MKGQKYLDLVDYANNSEKTSDLNNESLTDLIDLKEQFSKPGYANRNSAVTETHPIFGSNKLNYDNHDISLLRKTWMRHKKMVIIFMNLLSQFGEIG